MGHVKVEVNVWKLVTIEDPHAASKHLAVASLPQCYDHDFAN